MSRVAADSWIAVNLAAIKTAVQTRQATIVRRYPQSLRTHTVIPSNGGATAPDKLSSKTTDNNEGWLDLGITILGFWPATLEINNYGGPRGQGYEIAFYVGEAGVTYRRTEQVGPETERQSTWVAQGTI